MRSSAFEIEQQVHIVHARRLNEALRAQNAGVRQHGPIATAISHARAALAEALISAGERLHEEPRQRRNDAADAVRHA